jgi:hypothetical protein
MRLPFKMRRRKRLMAKPLKPDWLAVIDRNVPYYRLLPPGMQGELRASSRSFRRTQPVL